jgi:DNA mismatch repair protein MutL
MAGHPMESWESLYTGPKGEAEDSAVQGLPSSQERFADPSIAASPLRAIQVHNLYLVAETEEGIVIVDQHALHERVIYEQLRKRMTEGQLEGQRLLLPESFNVTQQQVALVEANAELFRRLGIEVTPFGTNAIAVHAFPALLKDTDVVSFMGDLLDYLGQQAGKTGPDTVINDILSMMACKAAVKAGDPLSQQEVDALFRQRGLIEKSSSCPHGRPTMLRLTKADLERQFKRK